MSFYSQYKDVIQVVYGTSVVVALYFGLSNKIDLIKQKHEDDFTMLQYQINELKYGRENRREKTYNNTDVALVPNEIRRKKNPNFEEIDN